MEERTFEAIRHLRREELEVFAIRTAMQMHKSHKEVEASRFFVAVVTGFLAGALVSASGFLLGAGFG